MMILTHVNQPPLNSSSNYRPNQIFVKSIRRKMANSLCCYHLSPEFRASISSLCNLRLPSFTTFTTRRLKFPVSNIPSRHTHTSSAAIQIPSGSFTWDDVFQLCEPRLLRDDSSDLHGFFEKVKLCNRNSEKQCEFIPFVLKKRIVGYVHNRFAEHLKKSDDVFIFQDDSTYGGSFGCCITLHPLLRTPADRTTAVQNVINCLGEELIPGIRNELFPVKSSFREPEHFLLERAAAPYFGIKVYGVQMNGYVEKEGQKYLWVGKRSELKSTFPGMLDELVAGGLPNGISCRENLMKECKEEAGIPISISSGATAVGAVSYMDIEGYRLKRDVLFCYDLKLPEGFIPKNEDGEVESFKLVPVTHVANIIRRTQLFKANCNLVIIDFLFRHGYIKPEDLGYLELLQSLRSGDCS